MEGIPGRNSKISKGVADLTCSVASHTDVKFSVFPLGRNKTYRLNKGKKKKNTTQALVSDRLKLESKLCRLFCELPLLLFDDHGCFICK